MSNNAEGVMAILAAIAVLLSAMWEPLVSAMMAAAGLLLIGIYELAKGRRS